MSKLTLAMALRVPANKAVAVSATATGRIVALEKLFGSSSVFALAAGTNANLQLDNGDGIKAVSALGAGVSQDAIVQVSDGASRMVQYKLTCTGAPVAPSVPAVTLTAGNGQISVAWVDGNTGGSPITSHRIYVNGSLVASPTSASPYVITGLTNGTSYSVQVSAVNGVGEGQSSTAQSATPSAAVPAAITTLAIMDATILDPDGNGKGINGNGWMVRATLPYIPGANFDPTKLLFTTQDAGFNSDGTTTTRTRLIQGGKVVRQQVPNGANLLATNDGVTQTVYFSLEDDVFQNTSVVSCQASAGFYGAAQAGAGPTVTNGSTRAYPKPGMAWLNLQQERATGSTFAVELSAAHCYMMNNQMVACVEFTATDGTNTTSVVRSSSTSLSSIQTKGQIAEVFKGSIPLASLTQATMCTVNARILPWLGDSSAVLDLSVSGAAWPTPLPQTLLRFFNDKAGTYGGAVAYVKVGATGGAIGDRSQPYPTIVAATTAIAAWNNTTSAGHTNLHNDHGGGRVLLMDDGSGGAVDHPVGNITANGVSTWVEIGVDPLATGQVRAAFTAAVNFTGLGLLRFTAPVVQSGSFNINGGSALANNMLAFEGGIDATAASALSVCWRNGLNYLRNNIITGISNSSANPLQPYGVANREHVALALGNVCTNSTTNNQCLAYAQIGNSFKRFVLGEVSSAYTNMVLPDGNFVYNNLVLDSRLGSFFGSSAPKTSLYIIQNILESANKAAGAVLQMAADGMLVTMDNVVFAYNTLPGITQECRLNWMYNDAAGSEGVIKRGNVLYSLLAEYNCKTDTFNGATSSTGRVGNFYDVYGVGMRGTVCLRGSNNGSQVPGYLAPPGNWLGEYWPVGNIPYATTSGVTWTNNQAGGSGAAGGGTYTLTGATNAAYNMVPAGMGGLKYDIYGTARRTDGTAACGAAERTV